MFFADMLGVSECAVVRDRARLTTKYTLESTLYDFDGGAA
jgi:hypothetical protein